MIGIVLAFTILLLLFRSLVFRRRGGKFHRVDVMNRQDGDDGRHESDSADEWPSLVSTDEGSALETKTLSEDERIELAVMQDRVLRMLR